MADQLRKHSSSLYDAVVVLGAGVSNVSAERLKLGLEILKEGLANLLVYVGGSEEERRFIVSIAEANGVEKSKIYVDTNSKNTVDNAYYAKAILRTIGAKRIALVTSAFHMQRALAIFEWVLGDDFQITPFEVQDNTDRDVLEREELLKMFIPLMKVLFAKGDDEGIKRAADLIDPYIDRLVSL